MTISTTLTMIGGLSILAATAGVSIGRDAAGAIDPVFFQPVEAQLVLFLFFAACHFSQFAYNLPVLLRGGRVGVAYWPVLKGPMLRIFVIDAALFVANLGVALRLAFSS